MLCLAFFGMDSVHGAQHLRCKAIKGNRIGILGKAIKLEKDRIVRSATIKTQNGIMERPAVINAMLRLTRLVVLMLHACNISIHVKYFMSYLPRKYGISSM